MEQGTLSDINSDRSHIRDFIPVAEPVLDGHELEYVTECIKTNWISSIGAYVNRFETDFAGFCGTKHAVATNNGTTALHLALACFGVGPGDEVIIPSLTFASTAFAVTYCGAKPVFVDIQPDTWCLDPSGIAAKITDRTKGIIPVHIYGHPADMEPIMTIAEEYGLFVLEDAAEAHGALWTQAKVGSIGDIGAFSFYGNKIITTGEGGMLTTDNDQLYERALYLRDVAMSPERRYWHDDIGYNYRLTNIQAAIGVAQLERINQIIDKKRAHAHTYAERLAGTPGLTLQTEAAWAKSVFWMYSVLIGDDFGLNRDQVMIKLKDNGIDSRPFFYPLHTMPPYLSADELPQTERISRQGINLPSGNLLSEAEINKVCETIKTMVE